MLKNMIDLTTKGLIIKDHIIRTTTDLTIPIIIVITIDIIITGEIAII